MTEERSAIAVYVPHFLSISMTFIHRQLLGQAGPFQPLVLTSREEHREFFHFPHPVYCRPRTWAERALGKAVKLLAGRYTLLTPSQMFIWKKVLRRHGARLIHAHFGPAGLEMLPMALALKLPLLVSFHGYDASQALRDARYVSELRRLFADSRVHIIAVSRFMSERLIATGADPSRLNILYYGVPLDDFRFVSRPSVREKVARGEEIEFLQVSNFVEKKGHVHTVRAFRELLTGHPRCRLTLAGDGPLRPEIEGLCAELGIVGKVRFVGRVMKNEVIALMERADIFVHHSVTAADGDQEGIPNVIMEAMASGLIPISTFHSGIPELIADGVDGFLVPEGDVAAYALKMAVALDCGEETGKAARRRVEADFNLEVQNEKLNALCRRVIDGA